MIFEMEGRLTSCALLAYRTPAVSVRNLLPGGLDLIIHNGFAFWNIVACRVEKMRPRHMPRIVGISYHHVAYRLYVRAGNTKGLYFLRSDADSRLVALGGNVTTNFRFHQADITLRDDGDRFDLEVESAGGDAALRSVISKMAGLSVNSCFDSPEEASVLKYQPTALSADSSGQFMKAADVLRDELEWQETPLQVESARWQFLKDLGQREIRLERATRVAPLDYRWRLGRRVPVLTHASNQVQSPPEGGGS